MRSFQRFYICKFSVKMGDLIKFWLWVVQSTTIVNSPCLWESSKIARKVKTEHVCWQLTCPQRIRCYSGTHVSLAQAEDCCENQCYWVVVSFFFSTPIWGRFPFWLIFFRWVETTNQVSSGSMLSLFSPPKTGKKIKHRPYGLVT